MSVSESKLGDFQKVCDPLADQVFAQLQAAPTAHAAGDLWARCARLATLEPDSPAARYEALSRAPLLHRSSPPQSWRAGQRMFERYGALTLLTGITTLVESYAGIDNHVLMMSGRLSDARAFRRLAETAKFTLEVVAVGGLEPGGAGREAILRVRLLHAHVRALCVQRGYDVERLGEPINQVAMAGTLALFSTGILRALRGIGVPIHQEVATAYQSLWQEAGFLLGVDPQLIASSVAEEEALWEQIKRVAFAPNEHSITLFEQLVSALVAHAPGLPAEVRRSGGFLLGDERFVRQFVARSVDASYARHLGVTRDARHDAQFALLRALVSGAGRLTDVAPRQMRERVDDAQGRRVHRLVNALLEGEPARFDNPGFE